MCRSIKTLRRSDGQAADDEVRAAALQFVRKVSGYRTPSRANEEAFNSRGGRDRRGLSAAVGLAEGALNGALA